MHGPDPATTHLVSAPEVNRKLAELVAFAAVFGGPIAKDLGALRLAVVAAFQPPALEAAGLEALIVGCWQPAVVALQQVSEADAAELLQETLEDFCHLARLGLCDPTARAAAEGRQFYRPGRATL